LRIETRQIESVIAKKQFNFANFTNKWKGGRMVYIPTNLTKIVGFKK